MSKNNNNLNKNKNKNDEKLNNQRVLQNISKQNTIIDSNKYKSNKFFYLDNSRESNTFKSYLEKIKERKKDSFSKEALDTLCEALSDYKDQIMVIIAGYEEELKTCFFSYNKGLESRFTWRFETEYYSAKELMLI